MISKAKTGIIYSILGVFEHFKRFSGVGSFKGSYNLEKVELWAIGRPWKHLKYTPADHPLPKQN